MGNIQRTEEVTGDHLVDGDLVSPDQSSEIDSGISPAERQHENRQIVAKRLGTVMSQRQSEANSIAVRAHHRQQLFLTKAKALTKAQTQALIEAFSGPITKCPTVFAEGYTPANTLFKGRLTYR